MQRLRREVREYLAARGRVVHEREGVKIGQGRLVEQRRFERIGRRDDERRFELVGERRECLRRGGAPEHHDQHALVLHHVLDGTLRRGGVRGQVEAYNLELVLAAREAAAVDALDRELRRLELHV